MQIIKNFGLVFKDESRVKMPLSNDAAFGELLQTPSWPKVCPSDQGE